MTKNEMIYSAVAVGIGLLGIGYALGQHKKLDDISTKLNKTIKAIAEESEIEIQDSIVDTAIQQAVDRAVSDTVDTAVAKATRKIERDIETDIHAQVSREIKLQYSDIKKNVAHEVEKKISRIDIDDLKAEIVEKAKEAAAEKLESSMDDILEQFKGNLENMAKIYKSISEAFPTQNKGFNVTLG